MKYQMLTPKEKLKIIEEAKYNGVVATCQKYGINHVNYYNWLKKIETGEKTALVTHKKKNSNEVYEVLKENRELKKLLEEKDALIQKYSDLINKLFPMINAEDRPRLTVQY